MSNYSGVKESTHSFTKVCGDPSPVEWRRVDFRGRIYLQGKRFRICTTTETWARTPYRVECKDQGMQCPWGYFMYGTKCCKDNPDRTPWECHRAPHRVHASETSYGEAAVSSTTVANTEWETWFSPLAPSLEDLRSGIGLTLDDWIAVVTGNAQRDASEPALMPQALLPPVMRGEVLRPSVEGPFAVEGADTIRITLDGQELEPDAPLDTAALSPGEHVLVLEASGKAGTLRASSVLAVQEVVDLSFERDVALTYGATTTTNSVIAPAVVENMTADEQSVTLRVDSAPTGWQADVIGERSIVLGPRERRTVDIHLEIRDPIALTQRVPTFTVAARLNFADDRSRDVVSQVKVAVDALPGLTFDWPAIRDIESGPVIEMSEAISRFDAYINQETSMSSS